MPVVICELEAGETMITEGGSMCWMSPNMRMETTSGGGMGKAFGRALAGEALFLNRYTAMGERGMIAFSSSLPGTIRPFLVSPGCDIVLQKRSYLAGEAGVDLSIFFQNGTGTGFFGGEGFIMQRISGNGLVFAEFDGHIVEYELAAGQSITVSTGHLAAMDASCTMSIQMITGAKNMFLGGEGFFNTVVTGPGRIYLQTMPISKLANIIGTYIPRSDS